jgi:hypothetical protein
MESISFGLIRASNRPEDGFVLTDNLDLLSDFSKYAMFFTPEQELIKSMPANKNIFL